jgi:dipeptidyl-peptidase-4
VTDSFPRQYARTQRFTVGEPRLFRVAADGSRVAFVRSPTGEDPTNALWVLDVASGTERLVFDPATTGVAAADLSPEERARRERAREGAGGIVSYATDPALSIAVFSLGGLVHVADLTGMADPAVRVLTTAAGAFDPQPDPSGRRVAYVGDRAVRIVGLGGSGSVGHGVDEHDRRLVGADEPHLSWGMAEFVAAEEMGRGRGFWWAPDGERLAVARVDVAPVQQWHIGDPGRPEQPPQAIRYPAAGTPNADVSLHVVSLAGALTPVDWDREALPYLVDVHWSDGGLLLAVQSRDQRSLVVLAADADTGATTVLDRQIDEHWVEIVPGVPRFGPGGALVTTRDAGGVRRLVVGGAIVTGGRASGPDAHLRAVVSVAEDGVVYTASDPGAPEEVHVWRWAPEGDGTPVRLTDEPGLHSAAAGGPTVVIRSATMGRAGGRTLVTRDGAVVAEVASNAAVPPLTPVVTFARVGERRLSTALLLPADGIAEADRPPASLPVLLDPYGGPHAQRVQRAQAAFLSSQWLAEQGFAVVVIDGRGTPGRGTEWERAVHLDLAEPVLQDQVDGLHAVAAAHPALDLSRVGIRGWSFGGYLAALAVLRRPDVFHAAVAGAPVTEWRLYDTHYTERYLGDPTVDPGPYDRTSLLVDAPRLTRPLQLIHGLADDNVVAAHTVRMSQALLEAGRPHTVLPLSGVTHMTPQEVVAENLLLLQVAFLREALGLPAPPTAGS